MVCCIARGGLPVGFLCAIRDDRRAHAWTCPFPASGKSRPWSNHRLSTDTRYLGFFDGVRLCWTIPLDFGAEAWISALPNQVVAWRRIFVGDISLLAIRRWRSQTVATLRLWMGFSDSESLDFVSRLMIPMEETARSD